MAKNVDIQKVMKDHPEIKSSLGDMIPNQENNIKSFPSIADARNMLKFLTVALDDNDIPQSWHDLEKIRDSDKFKERNRNLGSGQITDEIIDRVSILEYYTRTKDYAIMMFDALDCAKGNSFVINADCEGTVSLEAEEGIVMVPELIRMCIVKCCLPTNTAETVTHVDKTNSLKFVDKDGDVHYISKVTLATKEEKKGGETVYAPNDVVIAFDINETKGIISYYTESIPEDYIIVAVPLFWNKTFKDCVYNECKESWARGQELSFLKSCVETEVKEIPPYSDENKELIKSRIKDNIDNNKNFDLSLALYDLIHHQKVLYIYNAIDSIGEFDEFTVFSQLYPKFGAESIDSGDYKLDAESGLPVLGPKDVINLGIIGIDKGIITTTITGTKQAVIGAKQAIEKHKANKVSDDVRLNLEKTIIDLINSDAFTPRSIITNEIVSDDFDDLNNDHNVDAIINSSKEFIDNAYQQLAEFKLMSLRMEQKIKSGEFMNRSSQAYFEVLTQVFKKFAGDKFEDFGAYVNFLKTCSIIIKEKLVGEKRIGVGINETLFNSGSENPFTLENLIMDKIYSLVSFDAVEDDIAKKVDAIENKLSFIELLCFVPFKTVGRLYPESVFTPSTGEKPSESMLNISKKLFDSGFSCVNDEEYAGGIKPILETLSQKLETIRKNIESNYEGFLTSYRTSLDDINAQIASIELAIGIIDESDLPVDGTTGKLYLPDTKIEVKKIKLKNDSDKNRALARREILTQIKSHMVNIATGYEACDFKVETKNLNDKDYLIYKLGENGKPATISVEDYGKLDEKGQTECMILKSLSKEQIISYMVDSFVAFGIYIISMLCLDRISSKFTNLATSRTGATKNKDYQDFERKAYSTLSLLIPNITVIDSLDVTKAVDKDGKLDLSEIITNDMKVNFGPNVVNESLKPFADDKALAKIRCEFISTSVHFINSCLEFLM